MPLPHAQRRRLHLDLAPPADGDQRAEVERLRSLGATPVDIGQGDVSWVVLADPDGNEWEVFTVLEHLSPEQLRERDTRSACDTGCANACAPAPAETACCGA